MNKELIERLKLATVAIGYAVPKGKLTHNPHGVPEWRGSGFLVSDGSAALTCHHVMEGQKNVKIEEAVEKRLCCFMFKKEPNAFRLIKLPITGWSEIYKTHLEATHFLKSPPDVARLEIDTVQWNQSGTSELIPALEIERRLSCDVGEEIVVVGYPSPAYLIAQETGEPNCLGPLFQFGHVAGILPGSTFPLPHLLALDIPGVPGSSGSPVVKRSDGRVIGMVVQCLPALTNVRVTEKQPGGRTVERECIYPITSGITYALPCNFFAEFSTQTQGGEIVNF